ncbi:DNA-binding HTH domain, TetR-type [Spirosomataceae bacterium]|jgi:AcrR family transcriptional regulator
MQIEFKIKINSSLYLRDPDATEVGKNIVKMSIKLISEIGYEQFTFKKLAAEIPTTEATVYRYFENKHKLLIYLIDYYWAFIRYQVLYHINNLKTPEEKIKTIIDLLVWEDNDYMNSSEIDQKALYYIAITDGSKTFLSKEVDELNRNQVFVPYKELCELIASVFREYNSDYQNANSLASTLVETSHLQYFFMHHLPRLCDFSDRKDPKTLEAFLENLVFGALERG